MNIELPTISVLLPVYNGEEYLSSCITSVVEQEGVNFELLIADDCSVDHSLEIVRGFGDSRIRCWSNQTNLGLFYNLNQLLVKARAPIVRFLGQDDVLMPGALKQEFDFFADHPEIGMSFCKAILIDEQGHETGRGELYDMPDIVQPVVALQLFYYYGCIPGNISTVCARKSVFERFGHFNAALGAPADYDMWVRICETMPLGVLHQWLIQLRVHADQLSRTTASGMENLRANTQLRKRLQPLLPAEVQMAARRYRYSRHNVLAIHYAVRRLLTGSINDFIAIVSILGLRNTLAGMLFWLVTANNRLYRPRAKIVPE